MAVPDIREEYRLVNWVLACVLLVLAVVPVAIRICRASAFGAGNLHLPACSVLQHTGRPCAGCGLTRSVVALYGGDLALAATWHPAGSFLVALIFLQLLLRMLYRYGKSVWLPWIDISQLLLTGLLFKVLLVGGVPVWHHPAPPVHRVTARTGLGPNSTLERAVPSKTVRPQTARS